MSTPLGYPSRFSPVRSDAELVSAHLAGDPSATAELYERYHGRLVAAVASRWGDAVSAEDVAQDALLRAMNRLDRFNTRQALWPWLRALAANLAIDRFRSERAIAARTVEQPRVAPDHSDAVAERRLVREAMLDLPARQRQALVLSYIEGWSADEAARILGIARNAFDQLLFRARASLRKAYLTLEPEAARRVRLVVGPLLTDVLRRLRERLSIPADFAPFAQNLPAALLIPVVATSGMLLAPNPDPGNAHDPQRGVVVAALHGAPHASRDGLSSADARGAPRGARHAAGFAGPGQGSLRLSANAGESGEHSDRTPNERNGQSVPVDVEADTATERDGDRMRQRTTVKTSTGGDTKVERRSESHCTARVRRAICDVRAAADGVVATALDDTSRSSGR
jgi:RNA polymerase sigma-70 factor, ECF subfamily